MDQNRLAYLNRAFFGGRFMTVIIDVCYFDARLKITCCGQFFDAQGWEIYSRYDLRSNIRVVAGYNYQEPIDDQYTGQFNIRAFITGAQYTFNERNYSDMVYVEFLNDNGSLADGGEKGNIITIGGRYGFDW